MNTKTITKITTISNFLVALPDKDHAPAQPIYFSSNDYGFDFDGDEIGRELLAPLPANLSSKVTSNVDADESGLSNLWFLS
jgi:hypothetical protein